MKVEEVAAARLYETNKMLTGGKDAADGSGFADALESALGEMRASLEHGERAAANAMTGKGDVQSVVEALTATELALETATTVRDRVVEAYQEILRMPV